MTPLQFLEHVCAINNIYQGQQDWTPQTLTAAGTIDLDPTPEFATGFPATPVYYVTGTATVNGFEVRNWNASPRLMVFAGACTLVHSSHLLLPGETNYTTSPGDCVAFVANGNGTDWRILWVIPCGDLEGLLTQLGGEPVVVASASSMELSGTRDEAEVSYPGVRVYGLTGTSTIHTIPNALQTRAAAFLVFQAACKLAHDPDKIDVPTQALFTGAVGDVAVMLPDYFIRDKWECRAILQASGGILIFENNPAYKAGWWGLSASSPAPPAPSLPVEIASASTLTMPGGYTRFDVTGTTGITAMVTSGRRATTQFYLRFLDTLTLTHGEGLELRGAADYTTAAGDVLLFEVTGPDQVRQLALANNGDGGGSVTFASRAEAEAGTDTTKSMNPLRTAQAIAAQAGVGSGVSIVTVLPAADATTHGKLYLLDKEGTSADRLYVGIQSAGGVYRLARLVYDLVSAGGGYDANTIPDLLIWMKADALLLADGDPVSTWPDSSTNSNDATQGTSGFMPTFVENVVNGKPVVRFDGSDLLQFGTNVAAGAGTAFIVAKYTGAIDAEAPALILNGFSLYANTTSLQGTWSMYLNDQVDTGVPNDTFAVLGFQMRAADDIDVRVNDGAVSHLSSGSGFYPRSSSQIGTEDSLQQWLTGDVAEFLIWDRVLSDEEYLVTLAYLMDKYGFS